MEAAIYSFSLRGAELAKRIEAVLSDLDYQVSNKTALITVGGFLGNEYDRSELYNPTFAHGYREADPSKLEVKPEVK